MLRELLETEHELVHTRYRISHENRGTIGQTVYVFSDFILLDSDLCVWSAIRRKSGTVALSFDVKQAVDCHLDVKQATLDRGLHRMGSNTRELTWWTTFATGAGRPRGGPSRIA